MTIISNTKSIQGPLEWKTLKPNNEGDWINQRNMLFDKFFSIIPIKSRNTKEIQFFQLNGPGIATGRDSWVYNFCKGKVANNISKMINKYNEVLSTPDEITDTTMISDAAEISWTSNLKKNAKRRVKHNFYPDTIYIASYRPFTKQFIYSDKGLIERPGISKKIIPSDEYNNRIIGISSKGSTTGLSVLITKHYIDYHFAGDTQSLPLYYYEEQENQTPSLFDSKDTAESKRKEGISDFILEKAIKSYGKNISKEDIFYYVYGFLHSKDYRATFENDLKKMLPRIPLVDPVKDFWAFSKAGRKLADLHVDYEDVPPYSEVTLSGDNGNYHVTKMKFPKKGVKDTIIYNSQITISNIPEKAYEYVVNGKSAIEWIMERYQIKTDKKSGIANDPNDWCDEVNNPRYILDLLLSIINVSVQTVDIVNNLPKLNFEE